MDTKQFRSSALAMSALDDIPAPNNDAHKITALQKEHGAVTGYQLDNGQVVSKQEGVQMAKAGEIRDVGVAHRNGTEYLKSLPDDTESNNLSHLPTIK